MTDARKFEWPQAAFDVSFEMEENGGSVHEILGFLLPIVREALAAEYDRGYETAMMFEQQDDPARPHFDGWERGYEDAKKYYHALFLYRNGANQGQKPKRPRNPYV